MFDITGTKNFMDFVHGYISVPKCFVEHLIDTEAFQRLRNIDQTGMRILYPDAKHDRFGHSLGVFYLGCKAVDALLENFSYDEYWNISSDHNKEIFWAKNKVLFLIACLLHDIGHAPFSHSLERIVLENSALIEERRTFTVRLTEKLNETEQLGENIQVSDINASPHEKIGAMFIIEHLINNIEKIFDDLIGQQYPSANNDNILYAEHYSYNPVLDKTGLQSDICFIVRMILGLKYKGYEPEKQIRNCFIELLNGSNFDVDKLDYVIRDTKMSGISNIGIDIERLLGSVCIITKTKYTDQHYNKVYFSHRTVYSLKGNESSNMQLCGNFRGIIKLHKGSKVKIAKGSTFLSLQASENNAKIMYTEMEEAAKFDVDTEVIQNGQRISRVISVGDRKMKNLPDENGKPFECIVNNAQIMSDNGFCFTVCNGLFVELQVNGYCDIKIEGTCSTKSSLSFFDNTFVDGQVYEIILLGNSLRERVPSAQEYNEFSVGFKKQAINIIANVLEARDYLYLWIYAHHKVIYYANFLIPIVSKEILQGSAKHLFGWELNYVDIEKLDDAYVWTAVKHCRQLDSDMELDKLCSELLGRKYKTSLYKSLAEFDLLFESFTNEQKLLIKGFLAEHYRRDLPFLDEGIVTAGYLDEDVLERLKELGDLQNITHIVFVDASYKLKKYNPHDTFILMNDEAASIDKIPLLADRIAMSGGNDYYFYLYYNTSTLDAKGRKNESMGMKSAIKKYFKEYIETL